MVGWAIPIMKWENIRKAIMYDESLKLDPANPYIK